MNFEGSSRPRLFELVLVTEIESSAGETVDFIAFADEMD